jgi:hypothetical protein
VEELTATIARRLMGKVASAWEADGNSYLDPELAALCEAFFFSRNPPTGKRERSTLPGMEGAAQSKPLCAAVEGFSLHAAQSVAADDREALERLLRYGLRAPFSQERLSLSPDGKVIYRLRRPWPHAQGATHLFLEPHDFLRRLAALVSFPYSHQIRYHGVFAGRSRLRKLLPSPPPRQGEADAEALPDAERDVGVRAAGESTEPLPSAPHRRRVPWARLLRRVLHVDALSCPRCSRPGRSVALVVLAFLTDPKVVGKILRHLGLPTCAPALVPASPVPSAQLPLQQEVVFPDRGCGDMLSDEGDVLDREGGEEGNCSSAPSPEIRPPP